MKTLSLPSLLCVVLSACAAAPFSPAQDAPDESGAPTRQLDATEANASSAKQEAAPKGKEGKDALDQPGPIELETVVSARWAIPLGALVNLKNPVARAARLPEKNTPIVLVVHVLRHPQKGTFIVDTGVTKAWTQPGGDREVVGTLANTLLSGITPVTTLSEILAKEKKPLAGVFFTHMHIDHVLGLPEIPLSTPLYAGRGELEVTQGSVTSAANDLLLKRTFDQLVAGHDLHFWDYQGKPAFENIAQSIDVFGDGSLMALHVPGHTEGSTAFFVRTTSGPVLLTGDCSHTIWGWEHKVEPGLLSEDIEENADSLAALEAFVEKHPKIRVLVGHETDGKGTGVEPK